MTDIKMPPMPQAFFDEFGDGADDRVQDYAREAVRLNATVPCDCTTEIHADGTRKTWCGSDQMRRATEEGHAFAAAAPAPAAPQPAQQSLADEKDAMLRQALKVLEAYNKSRYVRHEHPKKYAAGGAVSEAIRNHLGVKND